jgi:serine/threonine protein kinase/formylglycine-generating enzyme required for sulfatase activity
MKECSVCKCCFPDDNNHCPTDGNRLKVSIEGDTILDGRYQLERRLGQGGMGIVFQGRHIFLKTTFAIKIILPDLVGNDPMLVTRFRQEAMVAARMHHQNLVNVTDFGVVHNMPYLVMELIVGQSLHDILLSSGRLSPHQSLQIMEAVCAGVGAAHRQGVVHRDLKPLNIMLMNGVPVREGVKVLDFGLAKIKSGELLGSFVAAQTTGLMGSPAYMAPELWSDDEPDPRADVYSMGIILFQMLSGEVPFRGATIPSIMKKHLTQPPPSFAEQGVIVPREIEAVVRRALAKARDDRHPSVESFAEEFRDAVNTMQSAIDGTVPDLGIALDARTMPFPGASSEDTLAEKQRRVEDEVEQLAREFEEAQLRADEARQRAEDAAKRKAEEDAARKHAEEEAARKRAEEEAARERAEEAARRQAAEEAERRKAEEAAERKRLAEIARKRAEEEAARKSAAEEAARLAREITEVQKRAEEARLRAEDEARKRTEEQAARQRAEEEARKLLLEVAESKRRAEEARQRAEEEARSRTQADAARRKIEEKAALKRAEEDARKRQEEEEKRKLAASEANRLSLEVSEAQRRADEAGKRAEEEALRRTAEESARRKAEEEARRLAGELQEAQLRVEEARKRVDEARGQAKVESQRHQEELAAAAHGLKEQSPSTSAHALDEQSTQSSAPPLQMNATIASMSSSPAELERANESEQFKTMRVQTSLSELHESQAANRPGSAGQISFPGAEAHGVAQQSHPSLQGSAHTYSSLGTIPDIGRGSRSKMLAGIIGGIALLILVAAGLGIALYSRRSSSAKPTELPAAPPSSDANVPAPAKPPAKPEMEKVEGGAFQMGRSDIDLNSRNGYDLNQYPAHQVAVTTFFMDRTEVTNAEYAAFVSATKHSPPTSWHGDKPNAGEEQWPVTYVSLADAKAFARWRSERDGFHYELPTEDQWEYAARNGSQGTIYPWGDDWRDNCANVGGSSPKSVGSYPNCGTAAGVLDLIGNVAEWTSTKAVPYKGADRLPVTITLSGNIIRGGSYLDLAHGPEAITAERRSTNPESVPDAAIGFRLVRIGP